MPTMPDVAVHGALAICESLLLALNDRKILPEREIIGILQDAAATHENSPSDPALNRAVVQRICQIIDGGNSVRRP